MELTKDDNSLFSVTIPVTESSTISVKAGRFVTTTGKDCVLASNGFNGVTVLVG